MQWDGMLHALSEAHNLRSLDLSGWHLPPRVVARLPGAGHRLHVLGLGAVPVDDASVSDLCQLCTALRVVHMTRLEQDVEDGDLGVSRHAWAELQAVRVQILEDDNNSSNY